MRNTYFLATIWAAALQACSQAPQGQGEWITGTESEKIAAVERQFRGFDMAMVETGYRYQELYWAGQDQNWEYAEYQVNKIKLAIENGLVRRPRRAASAESFLNQTLPDMRAAVESRDSLSFDRQFRILTVNCNNCHAMNRVPFFTVRAPTARQSPIMRTE